MKTTYKFIFCIILILGLVGLASGQFGFGGTTSTSTSSSGSTIYVVPNLAPIITDVMYHPTISRSGGYYIPILVTSTAFTAVGITLPTVVGTPTSSTVPGSDRIWIKYASLAVLNTIGGQTGVYTLTKPSYLPKYSSVVATDSNIKNESIFVGLSSASLATINATTYTNTSAIAFAAIGYSDSIDAFGGGYNNNYWRCCAGDGVNYRCENMDLLINASNKYTMIVDMQTIGHVNCTIINHLDSSIHSLDISTFVPQGSVITLGIHNGVGVRDIANIRYFYIAKGMLEQT